MRFTVLHEFKTAHQFEVGNTHDSEKLGIPDESVERWYRQGWVQIEGRNPAPAIDPQRTEIAAHDAVLAVSAPEVK